ncbi:hypothetical protein DXG01_012157, partial [Tephrocybe rancida]
MSMDLLDETTTTLGDALRDFKETCALCSPHENCAEKPSPAATATAPKAKKATKTKANKRDAKGSNNVSHEQVSDLQPGVAGLSGGLASQQALGIDGAPTAHGPDVLASGAVQPSGQVATVPVHQRKERQFNLNTYKMHALGDYAATIRAFGTTDSYSMETGELEHRVPKGNYKRTSKKFFQHQLASIDRRQSRIQYLDEVIFGGIRKRAVDTSEMATDPSIHYHIGVSEHLKMDIRIFLSQNQGDPAVE